MRVFYFLLIVFVSQGAKAQQDSMVVVPQPDSSISRLDISSWSTPKKATVLSAIIPGAGQLYNKRWWKAGLVYAGGGSLIYMFKTNSDSLKSFQTAYTARIDGDPTTVDTKYPFLQDNSVKNFRDYHRRNRDIAIVGFAVLYTLQIIDANVDAHLQEFRINKDLSMHIQPQLFTFDPVYGPSTGLTLQLKF